MYKNLKKNVEYDILTVHVNTYKYFYILNIVSKEKLNLTIQEEALFAIYCTYASHHSTFSNVTPKN